MSKYLSLIGVLLVLVVFHLSSKAEAQIVELDDGLEFYPSLSAQVTGGYAMHDFSSGVGFTYLVGGGYSWLPIEFGPSKQPLR